MKKLIIMCVCFVLTSCASYQVNESSKVDKSAKWVIMPISNHSTTPLAGKQAEQILSTILFNHGVQTSLYPADNNSDLASILDENAKLQQAQEWLETQSFDYIITGSVQEWHYKTGLDGEPAVGVTLEVIAVNTGETVWKSSGARAGWGRESVSSAGQKVIDNLVDGLSFD